MAAPARAAVPILPGPNPTEGTVATALAVLSAAAETIARIDVDAIAELITEFGVTVPDSTTAMVEAAAVFRASHLGTTPLPSAQLDRIRAWLLVHAPEQLTAGAPLAEAVIRLLRRALAADAPVQLRRDFTLLADGRPAGTRLVSARPVPQDGRAVVVPSRPR